LTRDPFLYTAGIQYAALSAAWLQFVPAPRREAQVEKASVDLLPKKRCRCARPGFLG
jgi:hypothetical protein